MKGMKLMYTLLIIAAFSIYGSETVKIIKLSIPATVIAGVDIKLHCQYELQGETLRSVKWYKGQHEFYRYFPRDWEQPKRFFLPPGLTLDKRGCDEASVLLTSVHADMSGFYTCEVTTEELFETVSQRHFLQVVQPPTPLGPEISGLPSEIPLSKWIKIICRLPWMNVSPKLEFFVNNKKAKHKEEMVVERLIGSKNDKHARTKLRAFEYNVAEDAGEQVGTSIALEVRVGKHHVNRDHQVEFMCRASDASGVYVQETIKTVRVRPEDLRYFNSGVPTLSSMLVLLITSSLQYFHSSQSITGV